MVWVFWYWSLKLFGHNGSIKYWSWSVKICWALIIDFWLNI
jgi:hypothetical protein